MMFRKYSHHSNLIGPAIMMPADGAEATSENSRCGGGIGLIPGINTDQQYVTENTRAKLPPYLDGLLTKHIAVMIVNMFSHRTSYKIRPCLDNTARCTGSSFSSSFTSVR